MASKVNWNDYYTPEEAAERLTKNSGKPVPKDYLRTLIRYGIFTPAKLGNINMYLKREVDKYVVEERGDKVRHKRDRNMRAIHG
jgi:hypothetical protein